MKIAVTYENGKVFQHFGHTEAFKIYEISEGKIIDTKIVSTEGEGHCALAGMLEELGVEMLICGGIGGGAQMALANADIQLRGGVSGDADEAVLAYISGGLNYNPDVKCDHHDHDHDHSCGHHDHGHNCGHGDCHH